VKSFGALAAGLKAAHSLHLWLNRTKASKRKDARQYIQGRFADSLKRRAKARRHILSAYFTLG
jgi:hypothetical protein